MRVDIHKIIGDSIENGSTLTHENWWGFIQTHENVNSAVMKIFAIFDEKRTGLLKSFRAFLKGKNIDFLTEKELGNWYSLVKPYKSFRHEEIAHLSIKFLPPPVIMYEVFLDLVTKLEVKLKAIQTRYIIDEKIKNSFWVNSTVHNNNILQDLKKLLT